MTAQGCAAIASMLHGVGVKDIMGKDRTAHIVAARWDAWALARVGGWSVEKIGREFNRHHTTILSGLQRRDGKIIKRERPIVIRGKRYRSVTKAAKEIGVCRQAIYKAIKADRLDKVGLKMQRVEALSEQS